MRTIVVTTIKEQHVDVDRKSIRVWFGDDVAEDIWKCRLTYGPMANMEKLSGYIDYGFHPLDRRRNLGYGGG